MRNFDQRMTEIKSRSHARITRRRKQVASLCTVFAVALCCGSGMYLLQERQSVNTYSDEPVTTTQTVPAFSGSVTVSQGNETWVYTEEETLQSFQALVKVLPLAQPSLTDANTTYESRIETTALSVVYTIEVQTEDGEVACYKLLGKSIINEDTDMIYSLTDQQRVELLQLLGLY